MVSRRVWRPGNESTVGVSRNNVTQLGFPNFPSFTNTTTMDSFDNFQYDSASSYGGIVDDTSSVYTANTQDNQDTDTASVDLSSLALSEYNGESSASNGRARHHHAQQQDGSTLDEDFDAVLDDLKDEAAVDLPAHACRYAN